MRHSYVGFSSTVLKITKRAGGPILQLTNKTGRSDRYAFGNHMKWLTATNPVELVFEETLTPGD